MTITLSPFTATVLILSLNVGLALLTACSSSAAVGALSPTSGVVGAVAVYLNVCGFHMKRIRPSAPFSIGAPTCS